MHRSTRIALAGAIGALLGGGLLALAAKTAGREPLDPYDRTLERHVEQAQAALQDSLDLFQEEVTWDNARRVQSAHYEIRTTHSRGYGLDLAEGLETMLGQFQTILRSDFEPAERFPVLIFPTIEEYNAFGGAFGDHSSFYGSFYAGGNPDRSVAAVADENGTRLRMAMTHSALHQFLDHAFPQQPPLWISEGLASYFALFWNYRYGVSELERIRSDERLFVGLDDLFTEREADYTDRAHSRFIELGMLFTYLLSYREDTRTVAGEEDARAPLIEYLRALLSGEDVAGQPIHELVTTRRAELVEALRTFDFGD